MHTQAHPQRAHAHAHTQTRTQTHTHTHTRAHAHTRTHISYRVSHQIAIKFCPHHYCTVQSTKATKNSWMFLALNFTVIADWVPCHHMAWKIDVCQPSGWRSSMIDEMESPRDEDSPLSPWAARKSSPPQGRPPERTSKRVGHPRKLPKGTHLILFSHAISCHERTVY